MPAPASCITVPITPPAPASPVRLPVPAPLATLDRMNPADVSNLDRALENAERLCDELLSIMPQRAARPVARKSAAEKTMKKAA